MNKEEIAEFILRRIEDIAPDADVENLDPAEDMRDELDLDSMDFLQLIESVAKELHVTIAVADYGKVASLDQMTSYIAEHQPSG